ncbi:MAG: VCBS repeat-containing protein [Planctomycetales bacterium]
MSALWRIGFMVLVCGSSAWGVEPEWSGKGSHRILVEVPPVDLKGRPSDELVARCRVEWQKILAKEGLKGAVSLKSLEVHKYDPATGKAEEYAGWVKGKAARPCRYEDDRFPDPLYSRDGRASESPNGRARKTERPRIARLFNREQDPTSGHLVWTHTQVGNQASRYAIYFDLTSRRLRENISPAPWIGDVDLLRSETGALLGGFAHFTATGGDLNGDELFDIVAGTEKGDLIWFPNRGESGKPRFQGGDPLRDEEGLMDAGWYAAPFVVDWNKDGLNDLLVGTAGNVILWWKNVGDKQQPKFQYAGYVQTEGKRLAVPEQPVAEDPNGIFKRDYYNQPWVGDVNGDGEVDVVTGGYTTGRIFYFRGLGRDKEGLPRLAEAVELKADGEAIDTVWAAAPSMMDVDGDGLLDLLTGGWFWSGITRKPAPGEDDYLRYYRNVGTKEAPAFQREEFPKEGKFPSGNIARPTVVDYNADGKADLLVSDNSGRVFVFLNVGEPGKPRWKMTAESLTIPWGFVSQVDVSAVTADFDKDETAEILVGSTISTLRGGVRAPSVEHRGVAKVKGSPIEHPGPGYGDGYLYTWPADWDGDGWTDLLWGTQQGNIYVHRKTLGKDPTAFEEGELLTLSTGGPLQVGPPVVKNAAEAKDFTVLQGSRIIMATEDFDRDGLLDLLVTETYGNLWFFRRIKQGEKLTLSPGIKLTKLPSRTESLVFDDWNGDGKPDLLLGGNAVHPVEVFFNKSQAGQPGLERVKHLEGIPYVFWGAKPRAVDWNGDGDVDLMIQSEFFSFWGERSFLTHGYREGFFVSKEGAGTGPVLEERRRVGPFD